MLRRAITANLTAINSELGVFAPRTLDALRTPDSAEMYETKRVRVPDAPPPREGGGAEFGSEFAQGRLGDIIGITGCSAGPCRGSSATAPAGQSCGFGQ